MTFALQLAGQEAQKGGLIVSRHLYETISNKGLWKDISIGTSYFDSLSQVAGTSNGWTWLTEEKGRKVIMCQLNTVHNSFYFARSV